MFQAMPYDGTRNEQFEAVLIQLEALVKDEPSATANLANASALLKHAMPDTNWAIFIYLMARSLCSGLSKVFLPASASRCLVESAERLLRNDAR